MTKHNRDDSPAPAFTGSEPAAPFKELLCAVCNDAAAMIVKGKASKTKIAHAREFLADVATVLQQLDALSNAVSVERWLEAPREIDGMSLDELAQESGYGFQFLWLRVNSGQIATVRDPFFSNGRRLVVPADEARRVIGYSRREKMAAGIRDGWRCDK